LLKSSSQSEVFTQSYQPPKLWEPELWEFQDSHLGVLGQNDIWVLVSWPGTEYKGEGGGSPQVQAVVSLVSLSLHMARPSTKNAPIMH